MNAKVSVIILNWNSADDTLACLESLAAVDYPDLHVLVVDNASSDNSSERIQAAYPHVPLLRNARNLGYAKGNNIGIRQALDQGMDYILIVNPDVRLPPGCLRDYVDIMSRDPTIAALNSIQLQGNGIDIDAGFRIGVLQPNGFDHGQFSASDYPETFESPVLYGAALMLSARALGKAGGFDPLFFAYYEEIDLCRRLRLHGFRLVVTPKSPVLHIRTQYAKPLSPHVRFLRLKGYYLSRLKNRERPMAPSMKVILREIRAALAQRTGDLYPYNTYPYDQGIILKTLFWLLWFLPVVWLHKKREAIPGRHYIE